MPSALELATAVLHGGPDAGGGPGRPSDSGTEVPKAVSFASDQRADSAAGKLTHKVCRCDGCADVGKQPDASGAAKVVEQPDIPKAEEEDKDDAEEEEELESTDFDKLAKEPFETLFSSPPTPPAMEEDHFIVRNLDTGEVRRLEMPDKEPAAPAVAKKKSAPTALTKSFVGEHVRPTQLAGYAGNAWSSWWAEKRRRDERVWSAAQSGCLAKLSEALAPPSDGGPPAEVNSKSLYGRTALHIAASVGSTECIEALLRVGSAVDQRTDAGLTALHVAGQRGHLQAVRLLLDWNAGIGSEDSDGNLSIHLAASCGHAPVVKLLIDAGGQDQLDHRNRLRQRPVEVARDLEVAAIFQEYEKRHGSKGNEDHYAGRTPFLEGNVFRPNARSDMVRRLLDRAKSVQMNSSDDEALSPVSPVSPKSGTKRSSCSATSGATPRCSNSSAGDGSGRQTFIRLRPTGSGIEQVGPDSFAVVRQLGRGSFGEVYQVKHKRTEVEYAMKVLQKHKISRGNLLRYAMTERNVQSYIRHPYIVSLHYAFQTPSHLVLVLHFCPGGNLQQRITNEKRLQEPLARLYSAEILLALSHLHERNIVFRDLKPENVVIDGDGHCMLTDFGLSKEGVKGIRGARSFCGSLAFLAPEILLQRGHGHAVDLYGLGVLLFAMLTGWPPFYHRDRETLFANIRHAPLQVPSNVSRVAASLIEALMNRDPVQRLGAANTRDVCAHNFFASIDWEALARREVQIPTSPVPSWPLPHERRQPAEGNVHNPFAGVGRGGGAGAAWRAILGGSPRNHGGAGNGTSSVNGWSFSDALPYRAGATAAV